MLGPILKKIRNLLIMLNKIIIKGEPKLIQILLKLTYDAVHVAVLLQLTLTSGITFIRPGRQLFSMFSFQTDCECGNYKNQTERYTHSTNYVLHLLPATNKIYRISQ